MNDDEHLPLLPDDARPEPRLTLLTIVLVLGFCLAFWGAVIAGVMWICGWL